MPKQTRSKELSLSAPKSKKGQGQKGPRPVKINVDMEETVERFMALGGNFSATVNDLLRKHLPALLEKQKALVLDAAEKARKWEREKQAQDKDK